jgi:hypothetical protein
MGRFFWVRSVLSKSHSLKRHNTHIETTNHLKGHTMRNKQTKVQILTENPLMLGFYVNHSERMCLAAVTVNGMALGLAKRKTPKVRMAAIMQNPDSIQFITNPTEEEQLAAVRIDAYAVKHIKNPSYKVYLNACAQFGGIVTEVPAHIVDKAMVDVAWESSAWAIQAMHYPSQELYLEAVRRTPRTLRLVPDHLKTDEMEQLALERDGICILWVRDANEEKRMQAITRTPEAVRVLTNVTHSEKLLAASLHGLLISGMVNLTKEIADAAVNNNAMAAYYSPWHDYTNPHTGEVKKATLAA